MKFYNYNHFGSNIWNAWKSYVKSTHYLVNSLIDYANYFNPTYDIINDEVELSTDYIVHYGDVVYQTYAVSFVKDGTTISTQNLTLYLVNKLNFREGFVNKGLNGILVYKSGSDYYNISSGAKITVSSSGTATCTITNELDINRIIDFPSGYTCILSVQPIGNADENSPTKQNINSFSILPTGNGGYYVWSSSINSLIAQFYENQLGAFSNATTVNISPFPLRLINRKPSNRFTGVGFQSFNLINQDFDTKTVNIGDYDGNLWTTDLIQYDCSYHNNSSDTYGERIVFDRHYEINDIIVNYQRGVVMTINSDDDLGNMVEHIQVDFL